ncbi:hypothetical protein [Hydrogenophaga sp.]|uniref:hypothetical protein n=1 Tax=Hydrogenophaga sp. TaxID=1904254 RepID=UPI0025C2CD94|nr:hypothetical protein [Hydrogenophaga sp.]
MSKSLFQRAGLLAAMALAAATLVACGGGSDSSTTAAAKVVALSDLNLPINTANKQAAFELLTAAKDGFTFTDDLTLVDNTTVPPTTETFSKDVKITVGGSSPDTMTFTMTFGSGMGSTSGAFNFGSCILEVPPGNPRAGTYEINNCSVNVALKDKTLTVNTPFSAFYVWLVATFQSNSFFSTYEGLRIDASGNVTYVTTAGTSILLGTVPVAAPTGATGSN